MIALWLALAETGAAPAISVEVAPTSACPSAAQIESALGARVGAPRRSADGAWVVRLASRPEQGAAGSRRLELRDPAGRTALVRDVPPDDGACEPAADVVALVVERYFRGIGWTANAPLPDAPPAAVAVGAPARTAPPGPGRLALAGGVAILAGRDRTVAFPIAAIVRPRPWLDLAVATALPEGERTEMLTSGGGTARLAAWPWRVSAQVAIDRGRFRAGLGPDLLLSFETGRTEQIAVQGGDSRVAVGTGAAGHVSIEILRLLSRPLSLGLGAALHHTLLASPFVVENRAGEVLAPSPWQGLLALDVAWALLL